jgi:hypothetical protein
MVAGFPASRPASAFSERPKLKVLAVAVCLLSVALPSSGQSRDSSRRKQGEALFTGRRPLAGKIRGHQTRMPPEVMVCAHCHLQRVPDAGAAAAPVIDGALLLEQRSRRGGPPSAYDLSSFCRMLRTGADPAHVLVDRVMPIYELSDAACGGLWEYLTK